MYLQKIKIQNIRSIKAFELAFEPKEYAGWHVVIGDNGSGKSTLVGIIALALVGAKDAPALRQNWDKPFRRFYGGDRDYERLFYSNPKRAPHLSVFGGHSRNALIGYRTCTSNS